MIVYKSDWENIHGYLMSVFDSDEKNYIGDPIESYDESEEHTYLAEPPKVHIRNGDRRDIYEKVLSPDKVVDNKVYRSVHYIVKYRGLYVEIQVRTLFEEGWGEVNHSILYPVNNGNATFQEYSDLLNRLSGLADEMSSFFIILKDEVMNKDCKKEDVNEADKEDLNSSDADKSLITAEEDVVTYQNSIDKVIKR